MPIGDATSLAVLGRELVAGCAAALCGAAEPSAPGPDYADYLRWQAAMMDGPAGKRLGAYWRERLAGEPLALDLPTDRPRPARRAMDGGSCPFALPQRWPRHCARWPCAPAPRCRRCSAAPTPCCCTG